MTPLRISSWRLHSTWPPIKPMTSQRIGKSLMLGLASWAISACSTIYFHSNADQKALDAAVAGVKTVKKTELDAIAAHKQALKQLIDQQRANVVREQIALRDEWLTNTIQAQSWQNLIAKATETQNQYLIGQSDRVSALSKDNEAVDLYKFIAQLRSNQQALVPFKQQVEKASSAFLAKGGVIKTPCASNGGGLITGSIIGAESEHAQLQTVCASLERESAQTLSNFAPLSMQAKLIGCIGGDPAACKTDKGRTLGGKVFNAYVNLYQLDALIDINKRLRNALKQQLEAFETSYRCALQQENSLGAETFISRQIRDFVASLPNKGEMLQETLNSKPPASPQGNPAANACAISAEQRFADLIIKAGSDPKTLQTLLNGLDKLDLASGDSLAATISEAKADFEISRLTKLLGTVAKLQETSVADAPQQTNRSADAERRVTSGLIDALGPAHKLSSEDVEQPPDPRAILVDLAMARYRQSLALIESNHLKNSREMLRIQADALLNQLAALDKSVAAANYNHREEAIIDLAESWNTGAIPAAAASVELRGFQSAKAAELDEAAVIARYDSLEPLLAELQAYGAGGFSADDIARFLSAAALVGVAVGAN